MAIARSLRTLSKDLPSVSGTVQSFDVLIVGGLGMVGASMACALASNPRTRHLRIGAVDSEALVSNWRSPLLGSPPDLRVSAITPASAALLEQCGAWPLLDHSRVRAFTKMQVCDSEGGGCMQFDAGAPGEGESGASLGTIVENRNIQSSLAKRLAAVGNSVQVFDSVTVSRVASGSDASASADSVDRPALDNFALVELRHQDGSTRQLRTRLLVGADGAQSRVRQYLGMSSHGFDYNQRGVVATVRTKTPHATAFQRFLPTGPVAVLPSFDAYSSIVWSTNPSHAERLVSLSSAEFCDELNYALQAPPHSVSSQYTAAPSAFRQLLPHSLAQLLPVLLPWSQQASDAGGQSHTLATSLFAPDAVELIGRAQSFPLRLMQADAYSAPRVALIGDAAHTVHPLAGQGLNIGLGDVKCLVAAIEYAVATGQDIGSQAVLGEYDRTQSRANTALLAAIHSVYQLFQSSGPLAGLRNIGMDAINATPVVKREIVAIAMGVKQARAL